MFTADAENIKRCHWCLGESKKAKGEKTEGDHGMHYDSCLCSSCSMWIIELACMQCRSAALLQGCHCLSVGKGEFPTTPTSACTAWHHLISPDSVHHLPSWPAAHNCALLINTNCSSLVRLPPRWVLGHSAHQAHLRGTHFLGSFATQPSPSTSSDNPSKPICLTVINCV